MTTGTDRLHFSTRTTPWLFQSFRKGDLRASFNVIHDYSYGGRIEFSGPERLGADDLRVLQGLVSLATKTRESRCAGQVAESLEEPTERAARLKKASLGNDFVIRTSYANLTREIGQSDLNNTRTLRLCISRMSKVSVFTIAGSGEDGTRTPAPFLIDHGCTGIGAKGGLHVEIDPRITASVLGLNRTHMSIDISEIRAIKSDPARLIHQRLCGWIDPRKHGRVTIDTLCSYAWPEEDKGASRMRRTRARKALQELAALGWQVEAYEIGKYRITRPGTKKDVGDAENVALDPDAGEAA